MGTIVCAVGETPEAGEALRAAARLSGAGRLRLLLVHVEKRRAKGDPDHAVQHARELLHRAAEAERLLGPVDVRVEFGERAAAIARVAEEEAASMIVLGSPHRRRWRPRPASGLHDVLAATAPCPVAVIPPPARE